MTYLYETHSHSKPVSICGWITPEELVGLCIGAGLSGIVLTDHFCDDTFNKAGLADASTSSWADYFLTGYHRARKAAKGKNFTVFLGMELRFTGTINEYLIYGLDESFFYKYSNPDFLKLGIRDFRKIADENKMLIFQAHPFRPGNTLTDVKLLDGIEVYNANKRADSQNPLALKSAIEAGLYKTAGSDVHRTEDVALSGLTSETRVDTLDELIMLIRSNPRFFIR